MKNKIFLIIIASVVFVGHAQEVAVIKYKGGGDWYSNPTALPNLVKYCNDNIDTNISEQIATVEPGSTDIFQYPLLHMTGHGNVFFSEEEAENLRLYLLSGGFIHVDDNYGMKPYITSEIKKVFPNKELVTIPKDHPIFSMAYNFPNGLPKIHEHDGKAPEAQGIFDEERLLVLFTFESDLGDGWEDQEVHNDPEEVRQKALRMGANIVKYAFEN
ncbi:DUF4159 domain-containing protein [Winogradskyella aurantiaca]|uniref:DUF4159 domain-containing protein n=1 Tax=Winogradskyella aurantiaca TaxID=2219558 RepID=UPI000E1CE3E2|nr:DUF4159 domain-containing protein [Winogradskyella aurantiaca]